MVSDTVAAAEAIAAEIAIAGGLIGTGMAQSGIGTAGMGIIAEKPEKFGQVLFFFVIPGRSGSSGSFWGSCSC